MLKREEIIEGMLISTTEENVFRAGAEMKSFPEGSIFKVKKLTKDKTNPDLYLYDENNNVWIENNFRRILAISNKHEEALDSDKNLHDKKKHDAELLKEIKKLAEKDNLAAIVELLENNLSFLSIPKHVKAIMSYAIKSQKTEVLEHGFDNNWFDSINWNENIITVDFSGLTPLGLAVKKSSEDVQKLLMLKGASLENKMTASYDTTIANSIVLTQDEKRSLVELSRVTNMIKSSNRSNNQI